MNPKLAADHNYMLVGARYAASHQQSVNAILGPKGPLYRPVVSRGTAFFNRDRWTARIFVDHMCKWAKKNPGCVPTPADVREWAREANGTQVHGPMIVIAQTPDRLPLPTALALTGGAYHEAFHTLYSKREEIEAGDVVGWVLANWARVPDWSKYSGLLQTWNNVVEDIRIERLGCRDYPGIREKMAELQNFILHQEQLGEATARSHGGKPSPLSTVLKTFRDLGLGYRTGAQRDALASYEVDDAQAVLAVKEGFLAPFLQEAANLAPDDDLGCIRLAMQIVATLVENSSASDAGGEPGEGEGEGEGEPGEGIECPQCGAPGDKLVVRPAAPAVKGQAILTCTVCGHQQPVQVKKGKKGKKGGGKKGPRFEDLDQILEANPSGEGEGEPGEGEGEPGEGEGEPGEGEGEPGEGEPEGEGGQKKGGQKKGGQKKGEGVSSLPGEHEATPGDGSKPRHRSRTVPGSGGATCFVEEHEGADYSTLASDLLAEAAHSPEDSSFGLMDAASALAEAVEVSVEKEDLAPTQGEKVWRPADPSLDTVRVVPMSRMGKSHDQAQAEQLLQSVMPQIQYFRSRLRMVIQAAEMTDTSHGLRRGKDLSNRFLVDSKACLMSGAPPNRAYYDTSVKTDTSTAVALVLDESGSMSHLLRDMTRCMMAIVEPMDRLGCASLVCGVRNGGGYADADATGQYHRRDSVHIDVFKGWSEPLQAVKYRFANTMAVGSTPLSDGVHYGLRALSTRDEGHRVLFVLTDGVPDGGHRPVMAYLIRKATLAGIHVVGVGLGEDARYVKEHGLFPDHVWAQDIEGIPKLLTQKLNEIFDKKASKRGARVRFDS